MRNDSVHTELAALRRDYDAVVAENIRLKAAMTPDRTAILAENLGLTYGMARIIAFLATGGVKSRDDIAMVCGKEDYNIRTIDSAIKRIRKVAGKKIVITAVYGGGYELRGQYLSVVRSILKGGA